MSVCSIKYSFWESNILILSIFDVQSFDFEHTWCPIFWFWAYLMSNLLILSIFDVQYFDFELCRNHNSVLSSCMTYHWVCKKSNTWVSHVEQELLTLPKHPSSLPLFGRVCVAQSLVFCVVFFQKLACALN
jgi:hypothetical protein